MTREDRMLPDDVTLTCSVRWSLQREALAHLTAGGDALPFLRLESLAEQRAEIAVTSTIWRIDLPGDTLFGSRIGLVDDGNSITCLDHVRRRRITVERRQVPPAAFQSPVLPVGEPWLEGVALPDGQSGTAVIVDLHEAMTGKRYRHRVVVDPHAPVGPLDRRLLELLLGDPGLHSGSGYPFEVVARLVSELGPPVESSIELLDESGEGGLLIGRFWIEDLRYLSGPLDDEGFRDFADGAEPVDEEPIVAFIEARPFTAAVEVPAGGRRGDQRFVEGASAEAALPQRERNGEGGPKDPPEGPPAPPPPPPMTNASAFGLLIQQRLLDEISSDVNRILGPLAGATFAIVGGQSLILDWLAHARTSVLASRDPHGVPAAGPGTFLFCLAHDVRPPALSRGYDGPAVEVPGWGVLAGRGLLDREAMKMAKAAVTTSTLTPAVLAHLPPATAAAVRAAGTDWSLLTSDQRLLLAFAVLLEDLGTVQIPLPASLTFNAADLVVGELVSYTGLLTLPQPDASGACPLITSLRCRSTGLDGTLMLGGLGITGTLNRRPGTTYLLVIGLSPVVALAIPALAWAVPLVASVGVFLLLDSATASLTLSGISADFQVRFVPDASAILKAQVTVSVTAAASVDLSSEVPTGLHQIGDLLISALASSGRLLVDQVGAAIGRTLTGQVARTFGSGFPAALFSLGIPLVSSSVSGRDDAHLYLESRLAAPAGTSPASVPVRADTRQLAVQDAARVENAFPSRRHYVSLVSSQNFLNVLLAAAFLRGAFNVVYSQTERTILRSLAPTPYPVGAPVLTARLVAESAPRLTLAQALPTGLAQHGVLELDMRLGLSPDKAQRFDWEFGLVTPVQVVVGSAQASTKPKIELLTAYLQPIDVLLDLVGAAVQARTLHAVEITRRQVTEETTSPRGKPVTKTYWVEDEVETTTALSGGAAAAVQPVLLAAVRSGLGWRDTRRTPRLDGIAANGSTTGQAEPLTIQTYEFDGTDPDGADPQHAAAFAKVDLGFAGGLLFQHLSLAGAAVAALDPDNLPLQTPDIAGVVLDGIGQPNLDP